MAIPARSLVMGVPANVRRALTAEEIELLHASAQNYCEYKEIYLDERGQ